VRVHAGSVRSVLFTMVTSPWKPVPQSLVRQKRTMTSSVSRMVFCAPGMGAPLVVPQWQVSPVLEQSGTGLGVGTGLGGGFGVGTGPGVGAGLGVGVGGMFEPPKSRSLVEKNTSAAGSMRCQTTKRMWRPERTGKLTLKR